MAEHLSFFFNLNEGWYNSENKVFSVIVNQHSLLGTMLEETQLVAYFFSKLFKYPTFHPMLPISFSILLLSSSKKIPHTKKHTHTLFNMYLEVLFVLLDN